MNHRIIYVLFACLALSGLSACIEEPMFEDMPLGEGESTVSFGAVFRPMEETMLGKTRSVGGDEIRDINDMSVVMYREDGSLASYYYFDEDMLTITDEPRPGHEESVTKNVSFQCKVPYGRYRIYAIANMGNLTEDDRLLTEDGFRALPLEWNNKNITDNNQMSGYFSDSKSTAYASGEVPLLTIGKSDISLHAWIRRAASKVTVAFKADSLYDNIYVYIQSAQIKDIPLGCKLVDENVPVSAEELLHEGDTIQFGRGDDYHAWPALSCGRGANRYGNHDHDAPSLFFYENMQGIHPNKHIYQNFKSKDNVPYGTYVEVKGYYINKSSANPSYGAITYRCMLGKNMKDDFNAERNTHYKLTLEFKRNANDVDWHIEYDYEPAPPEIMVPSPIYISYLANQSVDIPVTIYYDKNITSVKSVTAEIIRNDWGFEGHKYDYTNKELTNGFLSLELMNTNALTDRVKQYAPKKTYTEFDEVTDEKYTIRVPVYTRPMDMGSSFSGNNYFVGRRRYATVRLTVTLDDESVAVKPFDVEIIQSRRLVNPKGVWRKWDSEKPFRITLKNSDSDPTVATVFEPLPSDGPWTASIVKGADWVRIKDTESQTWGTEDVTGGTGSKIEFDYKPASKCSSENESRFGLIEIKFHNNTCTHMVLVSQGTAPVELDGRKWHMTNLEFGDKDVDNPLLEGSMFAFGNQNEAIMSSNNIKEGYGFDIPCVNKQFDVYISSQKSIKKLADIAANKNRGFVYGEGAASRVANADDWATLVADKYRRYYGILYGDECEETLSSNIVTNTYTNEGDEKGMRGCFVCDTLTGKHLFFPIGNTGYGRRKYEDKYFAYKDDGKYGDLRKTEYGVLKYSDRAEEMPQVRAEMVPNYYSLYNEPGAIYWYEQGVKYVSQEGTENWHYGFDVNYFSLGFEEFTTENVFNNGWRSDFCFVRRIDN
ncbi:MAG: DUF4906 domain-containing protein [Bacteroidales bacterium]|nr:DUF4906 domain-containing protein [Bacteroidales bacterium]